MMNKRFDSRTQAGKLLVEYIKTNHIDFYKSIIQNPDNFRAFAIPNGGVPVAESFCSNINIKYDLSIVRKIKIPYNPEAGFGSITTDGTVLLNEPLLNHLNLTEGEIEKSIEKTKKEIKERLKFYNKPMDLTIRYNQFIQNKNIILIDDGLASGFTMLAAINMLNKYNPKQVHIAVPTAPFRTIQRVKEKVHEIFCLNIEKTMRFAVANAYKNWYDVPESEVLDILKQSSSYVN